MLQSLIERIDRFLVLLASPFGVNVVDPLHRYGILLGMYAGIALLAVVGPPVLALAVLVYGLLGIFAVQRAWKVNEDLRVAIYRNLTAGRADDLPDLRGFALLSALQLLLIFPLLFRSLNQTFSIFSAPEEAGFGSWFAFSFDRFCKSLLDWSEIYGIHFTEITAQGVYGRHWIMFKSLTIDVILIQAGLRLLQIHGLRREAVEALPRDPLGIVRLGRRALAPLLWVLENAEGDKRLGAIQALGYYAEPTVRDKLLALAMDTKQPTPHRAMATLSLGQHGNPDVIDSLRQLAEDADSTVRAAAIEALGRFATPELFEWFMRVYLNDANLDVRRAALGVLERLATDETTRHLITGLRDLTSPNSRVRGSAAQSLGELGDRRAVVPLSQLAATDFAEGGEWGKVSVTAVYALKDLAIERVPGALEALQELLRHPDADLRGEVASVFSEIVDRRAIPSLLAALQDPHEDVRCNAATSLGELRDPETTPALIPLLADPEPTVSSTAVDAIASIQGPDTVESLIHALDHGISDAGYRLANYPEPLVVEALLRGLRSALNEVRESSADALKNLAGTHPELVRSLGVPEALRAALRDSYEGVRAPVAEGLGKLRDGRAVDALMGRLRDTDWVREQVVIALGRIGDEQARESLLHMLAEDGMGSIRAAAATALGQIRGEGVCSALCRALDDPESEVREKASTALGRLNDVQALPALQQRVGEDPEATVRQAALIAVGQCGTADSLGVLITALADETPVRKSPISLSAVDALAALADRGVPVIESLLEALAAAEDTPASRITAVLKKLPMPQVQPALEAALRDPRVGLRNRVAILMGEHCPVASAAALREALADPTPEVRGRAAWALGNSHSREAIPALVALLSDRTLNPGESHPPAAWAAEALGKLQALDAAEVLGQAARSAEPLLRDKAIQALGVLPLTTVPPVLLEALQDSNADIRCLAAQAIGRIGDPAAIPALTALLTDAAVPSWGETTVQICAALALGELRDPQATEPLLRMLQQESRPLRAGAARALALLYEPRAVPPILQALSHRNLTDQPIAEFSNLLDLTQLPESFETLSRLVYRNVAVADTFYALSRLGDPRAIEPFRFAHLAQRKKNADLALWGLSLTPGEEAFTYLVNLTRHEKPWTRGSAAHALGYRGEAAALEVLLRLTEDHAVRGTGSVAQSAIESLGYLPADDRIDARFREIIQSGDPACCRVTCNSLFWQQCPSTVPALRERLAREWREAHAATWVSSALYALAVARDSAAVPLMAEMLDDPNERFTDTALLALGFLGDASAEPLLRRRLDAVNPWHRGSAVAGLTLLGAPVDAAEWRARLEREEFGFVRSALKLALHAQGQTLALPDLREALRPDGWWAVFWLATEVPLPTSPRVTCYLLRLIEASNTNRYLITLGIAQLARQPDDLAASVVRKFARSHYPQIRRASTHPSQASRIAGRLIPSAG